MLRSQHRATGYRWKTTSTRTFCLWSMEKRTNQMSQLAKSNWWMCETAVASDGNGFVPSDWSSNVRLPGFHRTMRFSHDYTQQQQQYSSHKTTHNNNNNMVLTRLHTTTTTIRFSHACTEQQQTIRFSHDHTKQQQQCGSHTTTQNNNNNNMVLTRLHKTTTSDSDDLHSSQTLSLHGFYPHDATLAHVVDMALSVHHKPAF